MINNLKEVKKYVKVEYGNLYCKVVIREDDVADFMLGCAREAGYEIRIHFFASGYDNGRKELLSPKKATVFFFYGKSVIVYICSARAYRRRVRNGMIK